MNIKIIPSYLMLIFGMSIYAQEATEIYLFDLIQTEDSFSISNVVNISKNEGYDNQPSFTEDGTAILFSSMRNNQTDIARYEINENYRMWVTATPQSEYSPAPYPKKKKYFTVVRTNKDDTQFLYKYTYRNKAPVVLIPNLTVGYYLWFNNRIVISFVLGEIETLQVSNFKYKIKYPIQSYIGRSLNKIPQSFTKGENLLSFISKSHESPEIYSINPVNSEEKYLADALENSEDLTWTIDGTILMGRNDKIFKLKPGVDKEWIAIDIESDLPLKSITRIVVSPDGTKIAVVVGE